VLPNQEAQVVGMFGLTRRPFIISQRASMSQKKLNSLLASDDSSSCGMYFRLTHIDGEVGSEVVDVYIASILTPNDPTSRSQISGATRWSIPLTDCDDRVC
jgi:hypothetical protein